MKDRRGRIYKRILLKELPKVLNDPILKYNEKFISQEVQDWLSYPSLNELCCPAGFLRDWTKQPAVTERIRPSADGFIWLALSVQRPVYHHKPQTSKSLKKTVQIFSWGSFHSQHLKADWRHCQNDFHFQLPRGQTCDRVSLSRKAHFTVHWGRLLCRLFHNPNRIFADSRICYIWYEMLTVCPLRWHRNESTSMQHEFTYTCMLTKTCNWNRKIYHLYIALSFFLVFAAQHIFSLRWQKAKH